MSAFVTRGPIVLAHRGGAAEAPENSRAAVEHTLSLGLRHLETDVRTTRDGVAVLFHDAEVDRTTDGHGPLAGLSWAEASRLRDASGEPPLRLAELLGDYPGLLVNLDTKEDRAVAAVVRAIIETGALERVCLASFSDVRLRVLRLALGPEVAMSLGRRAIGRLVAAARMPGAWHRRMVAEAAGALCVQVPPAHRGVPVITPRFVAAAHRLGLAVHAWTIDDPREMTRLLDLGVDGIVTDRPSVAREVLAGR